MKVAQVLDFVFHPRTMCFAEADAAEAGAMRSEPVEAPEIEVEIEEPAANENEPDDLEEIEHEGRKHKIPKSWKDNLEQGKDYRFKTGKLSEERRAVEADKARYVAGIQEVEKTLKAIQPPMPDAAMLDRMSEKYDPDTYHLQRARWEKWAGDLHKAQQERQRLEGEEKTKAERERADRKAKSEAEILKAFPQWKDPAVKAADRVKMQTYAQMNGVDADEFGEIDIDHRLAKFVHKAMLYDAAVEKARARKTDEPAVVTKPAPTRKVGGGGGNSGGIPKTTEDYIKWRRQGGKM